MRRAGYISFFLVLLLSPGAYAGPAERSGVALSYGWTGLPSFAKSAFGKSTDTTYNLEGSSIGVSYISYGERGPDGMFSGRYTLTYAHYHSLPNAQEFTAQNADVFMFDAAEILTMFPSQPVNLYTGIGMGWGVIRVYHWGQPAPGADPNSVKRLKNATRTVLPFPTIYIPIGLNVRVRDFIISAESGIRDFPYLVGMVTYTFGAERHVRVLRGPIQMSSISETGKVSGRVVDRDTGAPIGMAVIEMKDTGLTDLSTGPSDGTFTTPGLRPGNVDLHVLREGYTAGSVTVTVNAGETVSTTIPLEKRQTTGTAYGTVSDTQGRPLSAAVSAVPEGAGAGGPAQTTADPATGRFLLQLKAGSYAVSASLSGYGTVTKIAAVRTGIRTGIDFTLHTGHAPPPTITKERPRVFIEKEKKRIVITESIFFRTGRDRILPRSFGLLDEVAIALRQNPGIKIRIEGYTDSTGRDQVNMRLSQARAEAVMKYLAGKGISPDRMTAKGYGKANPIASNRTAVGRAKNRRVEFVITGQ
ncbi:MAG: OmpA family protein [Deltaproteobacteria bacterium]|nr:OmpA family protein [Deltaproteobacteria bacterium]